MSSQAYKFAPNDMKYDTLEDLNRKIGGSYVAQMKRYGTSTFMST